MPLTQRGSCLGVHRRNPNCSNDLDPDPKTNVFMGQLPTEPRYHAWGSLKSSSDDWERSTAPCRGIAVSLRSSLNFLKVTSGGPHFTTFLGMRNNIKVCFVFPECVARVPVSLWGSGGWGCVRSTLRSRAQPFATVRNRSRDPRMAVPMGSSAEVVIFGGFRRVVASFRVAGVALRDIQTCSATCRKSFCMAGAILLRRFQKMCCSFRGRRSTLGVSIVIFRGRRSTLDVSRCVFFANRIGRAASSGDKVQIPWQAWHFVRCAENWRKPRTKHRFWCCQFSGSKENS